MSIFHFWGLEISMNAAHSPLPPSQSAISTVDRAAAGVGGVEEGEEGLSRTRGAQCPRYNNTHVAAASERGRVWEAVTSDRHHGAANLQAEDCEEVRAQV